MSAFTTPLHQIVPSGAAAPPLPAPYTLFADFQEDAEEDDYFLEALQMVSGAVLQPVLQLEEDVGQSRNGHRRYLSEVTPMPVADSELLRAFDPSPQSTTANVVSPVLSDLDEAAILAFVFDGEE